MIDHAVDHLGAFYFSFEERYHGPYPVAEDLPDLFHVFILHLDPVENKF